MTHSTGNRLILSIAIPAIVSNITVPLLSLADTTIVGHLGETRYIGAIAVGGMLFNLIYWIFGFLRMGTSGLTAQACGRHDAAETHRLLKRTLLMGGAIGFILIMFQSLLLKAAFHLIVCSPHVEALARLYFGICIWGAPAVLMLYGLNGWFLGMQNSRIPMYVALLQNIINILASLVCVFLLHLKMEGVACGTVVAQYAGFFLAWRATRTYTRFLPKVSRRSVFLRSALGAFCSVNRDIFLRTLFIVAVMTFFTSRGAAQSDDILAANALLMQLFLLFSFFMDGFAYAGEALSGRYIGGKRKKAFLAVTRRLFVFGGVLSVFFSLLYWTGGTSFLALLTNQKHVVQVAGDYCFWIAIVPLASVTGFLLDGIFIGATATRAMLFAVMGSAGLFFAAFFALYPVWGNHALWLAFVLYLGGRGLIASFFYPGIAHRLSISDKTQKGNGATHS